MLQHERFNYTVHRRRPGQSWQSWVSTLNDKGQDGWEVCGLVRMENEEMFILKRRIVPGRVPTKRERLRSAMS